MPASPPALPSGDFVRTVRRVFLLVPLAVAGLLLIGFVVFVLRSGADVRRLESAARARSEPFTLAEVAQTYAPIPDEENAAVPLLALWRSEDPEFWEAYLKFGTNSLPTPKGSERLRAFRDKSTAEIRRGEFSAAEVEQLTTEVADHAAHREAVREALARPQFRFPLQLAAGAGTLMPHLARMKEVALEFRAEGWLAVQLGDADRAIRALTDSASLAQLLQDEPILISQLVRISGCALALSQAEQLLSRLRLDEHHLGAVETAIRSLSQGDGFRDSMIHERACGIAMFENPKMLSAEVNREEDSPENQYGLSLALAAYGVTGLRQADKVVFLATFEHQLTNAPLNAPERLSAVEAAGSNEDYLRNSPSWSFSGGPKILSLGCPPRRRAHRARHRTLSPGPRWRLAGDTPAARADVAPEDSHRHFRRPTAPLPPAGTRLRGVFDRLGPARRWRHGKAQEELREIVGRDVHGRAVSGCSRSADEGVRAPSGRRGGRLRVPSPGGGDIPSGRGHLRGRWDRWRAP
jgi:hypothetical protein